MPSLSKKESRFLNWKKGHAWVKRHHFDNPTKNLPDRVHHQLHRHMKMHHDRKKPGY